MMSLDDIFSGKGQSQPSQSPMPTSTGQRSLDDIFGGGGNTATTTPASQRSLDDIFSGNSAASPSPAQSDPNSIDDPTGLMGSLVGKVSEGHDLTNAELDKQKLQDKWDNGKIGINAVGDTLNNAYDTTAKGVGQLAKTVSAMPSPQEVQKKVDDNGGDWQKAFTDLMSEKAEGIKSGSMNVAQGLMTGHYAPIVAAGQNAPEPIKQIINSPNAAIGNATKAIVGALDPHTDVNSPEFEQNVVQPLQTMLAGYLGAEAPGLGKVLKPIADVAAPVLSKGAELAGKAAGKAGEIISNVAKEGVSKVSGLNSDTLDTALENPKELSTARKAGTDTTRQNIADTAKTAVDSKINELTQKSSEAKNSIFNTAKTAIDETLNKLKETGSAYDTVRNLKTNVEVPNSFFSKFMKSKGLEIGDARQLIPDASSSIRSAGDLKGVQQIMDLYGYKTRFTPNEFLNLRTDLSELGKYSAEKTNASSSIARDLRSKVDAFAKDQLPGLKELDSKYSPLVENLKGVKKLLYDNKGNLKTDAELNFQNLLKDTAANKNKLAALKKVVPNFDGFVKQMQESDTHATDLKSAKSLLYDNAGNLKPNVFENLGNKANVNKLAKVEELAPGTTQNLKILKALKDIEVSKGIKVGNYGHSIISGGALLTGGPVVAIMTHLLTSPSIVIPLLESYGRIAGKSADFVKAITENIKQGIAPKGVQESFVKAAIKKVKPSALKQLMHASAGQNTLSQHIAM